MHDLDYPRLWSKVDIGDCWHWTAGKDANGYGKFRHNNKTSLAHRVVYRILVGEIPEGLQLDHLCRNRSCVNPDHLEPVTGQENQRRGVHHCGIRGACPRGHEYDEENTRTYRGKRYCRSCERIRMKRRRGK